MILRVQDILQRSSEMYQNKVALIDQGDGGKETTFLQLEDAANRFANGLIKLGIEKGDRVALLGFNSTNWVIARYGISTAGGINVPINYRLTAQEIDYILDNSGVKAIFVDQNFLPVLNETKFAKERKEYIIVNGQDIPEDKISVTSLIESSFNEIPNVKVTEFDEEMILYTSGTTGKPKGAVLQHFNTKNVALAIHMTMDFRHTFVYTSDYPFFSSGGAQFSVLASIAAGQTMVINPYFDPQKTLETIQNKRINLYFCVPAMLNFILNLENLKSYDVKSLKYLLCGGGPLPFPLLKAAKEAFPGVEMCNVYGLSEGGPGGICLADEYVYEKQGSVGWGKSILGMEMIIADENQNPVKPGEIGECLLRGNTIIKEYYNNPEETKNSLKNGWLHTGDIGRLDEDGFIWLMDRKKDMIVRGGYNVYPAEIESVLYAHPSIQDAAVIGVPHEKLGEDVKAFIVLKENQEITANEIKDFCKKSLADFKQPRHIEFIKELPRNTAGKVLKWKLRGKKKE